MFVSRQTNQSTVGNNYLELSNYDYYQTKNENMKKQPHFYFMQLDAFISFVNNTELWIAKLYQS